MAGPPNEDVKALREDLHKTEVSLRDELRKVEVSLREDIHRVDVGLAALKAEFSFAKWLIGGLLATTMTGIGTGIWLASGISNEMKHVSQNMEAIAKKLDTIEKTVGAGEVRPGRPGP
jgi:hypothetical protein